MLTWQDFDTVAPMFDEGSALAIDTRRYDAFGYPYGEGVMAAVPHMPSAAPGFSHVGTEVFFNKASSAYKVCARGEDPSCAASVVVASGVDDHASYMGESFAAKHLECALAPSTPKALEAAAKALAA